ncbi:MAG: S8 family serine peptidase [Planctomycetes bacterium]|jgi:hypothetical protein|nr:S8 family serine peptidase [Planctomycetota bacterium]
MAHVRIVAYGFRLLGRIIRIVLRSCLWAAALVGVLTVVAAVFLVRFTAVPPLDPDVARKVQTAAAERRLAYRLTEPNDLIRLLGMPMTEMRSTNYDVERLQLHWPGVSAAFTRASGDAVVFTLDWITLDGLDVALGHVHTSLGGTAVDVGVGRPVTLRHPGDLRRLDVFAGLQGAILTELDLRDHREALLRLSFDNLTRWPKKASLPDGFDPNVLLEEGKNPGLGIRQLHAQGIDGRGVRMAIVDLPLRQDHHEYADRLVGYENVGVVSRLGAAQIHGPAVASIAVGRDCGVAPGASLHFFAFMPMSMPDNEIYCGIIDTILQRNEQLPSTERIRVVSISYGMFSRRPQYDRWRQTVERARRQGVLIVTCDSAFLDYGTLVRVPGADPDDPANYRKGRYGSPSAVLLVPAGHRTIASERSPQTYKYDPLGGMSWSAPYLAGLAALAFQVEPGLDPDELVSLLTATATAVDIGRIVNPREFIAAVREKARRGPPAGPNAG